MCLCACTERERVHAYPPPPPLLPPPHTHTYIHTYIHTSTHTHTHTHTHARARAEAKTNRKLAMQFTVQKKGYSHWDRRPCSDYFACRRSHWTRDLCSLHRPSAVEGRELLSTEVHVTSLHRCFETQTGQSLGFSSLFRDFTFSKICLITQSTYR